jgi:hypothetical protein
VKARPAKDKHDAPANSFRQMALSLPGAIQGSHQGHADFRVGAARTVRKNEVVMSHRINLPTTASHIF